MSEKRGSKRIQAVIGVSQDCAPRQAAEPDTDFWRLARELDAPVVGNSCSKPVSPLARIERATALDIGQAIRILRTYPSADVYISFSERVGIPLAILLARKKHRPRHVMIAHKLNSRGKRLLGSVACWQNGVDRIITLCSAQLEHAERILPGKAVFVRGGTVDECFYTPADVEDQGYILSVGSESRDYRTLIEAVAITGQKLKILSSSPWSRAKARNSLRIPENVEFLPRVSFTDLRDLYRHCTLVALPLNNVDYVAGHNGLLESFCVNKAVIVSDSRGIRDYVEPGINACSVPVGDSRALAEALTRVSGDLAFRERLIQGGQRSITSYGNLPIYALALAEAVRTSIGSRNC